MRRPCSGPVQKSEFDALCDNLDPRSEKPLTARTNDERTVGYDFNWHVPKGVSIAYALNGDERILEAFRASVTETMHELEADAKTRVRKQGRQEDRTTGNLVWADFTHTTARPVEGIPDPHLHAHCFVFNATFDSKENRWKAAQFRDLKRDAPYYEAAFHSRLGLAMKKLGYTIERRGQTWDIAEVDKTIRSKFSRRTDQIEELAQKRGITDPKEKERLGAKTRQAKAKSLSWQELVSMWRSRLSEDESQRLRDIQAQNLRRELVGSLKAPEISPSEALQYAMDHCFEREAVVPERTLLAEALKRGVGSVQVADVRRELDVQGVLRRDLSGRRYATTREVLAEEQAVLDFARESRGLNDPLNANWKFEREWLSEEQKQALRQLLTSRDGLQLVRGAAGAGKTTLLQEAVTAMEATG